jgi:transaldolase
MERLVHLFAEQGQSPWLDNLKRGYITSGELARLRDAGIRGLTSNPTIFQKAIQGSPDYDEQFGQLVADGRDTESSYWELVTRDIHSALEVFAPVYGASGGRDGFVSLEVSPELARDAAGTAAAARHIDETVSRPNLMVKIPATIEGISAISDMIAEGRNINVTLIFSLDRYAEVMEAYISGLERFAQTPGADLSTVASVASFFISRVDTEVDRRLDAIGTPAALALRGKAAVAQGQLAYEMFATAFSGPRWEALAARGARVQRPLWASTSTKNPAYPDTLYVDQLIGPDTVNTMPDTTVTAFADHGTVARTVDADLPGARAVWDQLTAVGVDLANVATVLESEGLSSFAKSFTELLAALDTKAAELRGR